MLINGHLVYAGAAIFSAIYVPGDREAVLAVLLPGLVNFFIRPLIVILTIPITILTLGLFLLVINGAMVLLVDGLLDGFNVDGLIWGILLSVLLAIGNFFNGGMEEEKR